MLRNKRVCYPFVGDSVGGSHLATLTLIKNLAESEYEPFIVLFQEGKLSSLLKTQGRQYALLNCKFVSEGSIKKQLYQMIKTAPLLKKFIHQNDITLVHTNDIRMHATWAMPARFSRSKFIWHQHTANDSRRNGFYSCFAHKILTISNFCRQSYPLPMSVRAQVVHNPFEIKTSVDKQEAKQRILNEIGVTGEHFVVGFVGNLVAQKRPLIFVETAHQILSKSNLPLVFPIIGEMRPDETEKVKKRITELNLQQKVFLLGSKYPIEAWIAGYDMLLAPGVNEGFGRTIVEAMLFKVLVIASDMGGHREIIQQDTTGFLVPAEQPEVFSQKALELMGQPKQMESITQKAKEYALSNFSAQQYTKKLIRIYNDLSH